MAVKASAHMTLSYMVDIKATYRYYLLQSATLSKPSKPTEYPPPSPWDDTEPSYTEGSTKSLYFVDCTVFTNDEFDYSEVSLSSSYEAAKVAYNKAVNAQQTANGVSENLENLAERVTDVEIKTTDDSIISTVRSHSSYKNDLAGKVSTNNVISCINQSSEDVSILASKINLSGAVTLSTFDKNLAQAMASVPKKINTHLRQFTAAQWQTYGAKDHVENWTCDSSYDNSHINVGDTAYILGICTNAGGSNTVNVTLYGEVTEKTSTGVRVKSIYYTMSGEGGAYALANSANSAANTAQNAANSANTVIDNWCYENDKTYINGGKIYTGTITADKIAANTITADKINLTSLFAQNITATGSIKGMTFISEGDPDYSAIPEEYKIFANSSTLKASESVMKIASIDSITNANGTVSEVDYTEAITTSFGAKYRIWLREGAYRTMEEAALYVNGFGIRYEIRDSGETSFAKMFNVDLYGVSIGAGKATISPDGKITGTELIVGSASIQSNGYVTGTWLRTTAASALTSAAAKIAVLDGSGWIYYRTPAQILSDIGAAASGHTHSYLPLSGGTLTGALAVNANLTTTGYFGLDTSRYVQCKDTNGTYHNILGINTNNNLLVGYGMRMEDSGVVGDTYIYGKDIRLVPSGTDGNLRPYWKAGDSVEVYITTAGFVSSSKQNIYFIVPLSKPIIGSPTGSSASVDGFILRQDGNYTHGTSSSTYKKPSSYTTTVYEKYIRIVATFSTTTNAVNNAPIGIVWSGKITFS